MEYDNVVVTLVRGGKTFIYELERVSAFQIEVEREPKPYVWNDSKIIRDEPVKAITFSMRPLPEPDGKYMTIKINEESGWAG